MTDRDRLIELLKQVNFDFSEECIACCEDGYKATPMLEDFFADHLLANGVIVPKYKVGDTVWYITGIHRSLVKSAIVEEIIINCNGVSDLLVTSDTATFENSVDIFYPTKEEAEQKSKELKGNENR